MAHPQVFRHVGYDPERVTGWAFGMGVERIAMLKWECARSAQAMLTLEGAMWHVAVGVATLLGVLA